MTPKPTETPAPTATEGETSTFAPSKDDLTADTKGAIELPGASFAPGDQITVNVGKEHKGESVKVVVFSEPQDLGDLTVNGDGTVTVQLPDTIVEGEHDLAIYDADGNVIGWHDLTVTTGDAAAGGEATDAGTAATPSATLSPSASASTDDNSTTAPLSVIPRSDQSADETQADASGLAVTGPANVTPIIAIVALGVAAGLGLLLVARRDRMEV